LLKLKRVELQGFKSFCERTELRFNGAGIAGIVGPNGCGKSNISDAISWVLGEQSAKSLRGTRMEDVIFAGTRDRKPLGMAYVTMTLVDPEHYVSHDAHKLQAVEEGGAKKRGEITITRRLFRNGDSEYLIDGRTARLRDRLVRSAIAIFAGTSVTYLLRFKLWALAARPLITAWPALGAPFGSERVSSRVRDWTSARVAGLSGRSPL